MSRLDTSYAAQIALEATLIMVAATKSTNLRNTAAYYCREAQTLRRQIEGRA
jgi:hypothetical protein